MKLNIILEGCDLSGKSMLANKLVTDRGYIGHHFGKPFDGNAWWIQISKAFELAKIGGHVFDREPCISNTIYRPIFHHPYSISRRNLFKHLNKYPENTIILWLNPSQLDILKRFKERGDQYLNLDQIITAKDLYESLFYGYYRLAKLYQTPDVPQVIEVSRSDTCSEGLRLERLYTDIVTTKEELDWEPKKQ